VLGRLKSKQILRAAAIGVTIMLTAATAHSADNAAGERLRPVSTTEALAQALREAQPGDTILLASGTYVTGTISTGTAGTKDHPITLRSAELGGARLRSTVNELIRVHAPYWIFEGLDIACSGHGGCEHAFHITGPADHTIIRNNRIHDFDTHIKGNGENGSFPADVLIESNMFFNSDVRQTNRPAHPIDVVGGVGWTVRGNLIADFGSTGGPSFAGYMKGHSSHGMFERNLVICELKRKSTGLTVGLSFGGGGTGAEFCQGGCAYEHENGIMRNNIIMNCPKDIGIYLNRAHATQVLNNTLYDTYGMDVRFPETSSEIRDNVIAGGIRLRDGALAIETDNLIAGTRFSSFIPPGLRFLKSKLEGVTRKYPNYTPFTLAEGERSVDWAEEKLSGMWFMRGTHTLDEVFSYPKLARFDLAPGQDLPVSAASPLVPDDFCGHRRPADRHTIGAVEPKAGACPTPNALLESYLGYSDKDPGP
jgi:hypothetical protein